MKQQNIFVNRSNQNGKSKYLIDCIYRPIFGFFWDSDVRKYTNVVEYNFFFFCRKILVHPWFLETHMEH